MTPPVPLNLIDLLRTDFRATSEAEAISTRLQAELGLDYRYQPARLAMALSLSDPEFPPQVEALGKPIRGETLFSAEQAELAIWVGLFTERAGAAITTRRGLQEMVASHWTRGIRMLSQRWAAWNGSPASFLANLWADERAFGSDALKQDLSSTS